MQQESGGLLARFTQEIYDLGRFAGGVVPGICGIHLLCTLRPAEEYFLAAPEGADVPQALRGPLRALAGGADAPLPGGGFFECRLTLPGEAPLGAVCFERASGAWAGQERAVLESIALVYAHALRAARDRQNASLQNWVWNHMMDSTHACIYVTDPETDEILFMNGSMKRAFGLSSPEGQICWKVLQQGQTARCPFCPVQMLLQEKDAHSYVWEERNPITGRIYENFDSLMRWTDGRLVHFQHSTDVTEARRLYRAATVDELTGALSRRAGRELLTQLLEEVAGTGRPLCVCMLDVNDLKAVNDLHGHAAGDTVLVQVSAAVRGVLGGREALMRLGGDEFAAVLPDVRQAEAAARMQAALDAFEAQRPAFAPKGGAFCYGVVEVREPLPLRDVLARADECMYGQKRALHIHRAQALLERAAPAGGAGFTYDTARLYDALIASTESYIYVCDMKTGVFRYPPAMVREFGLPGEVVPNAAAVWGAKVHPHDKRAFLESNQEITDGRTDRHCVEYRAQNVRGEWVWLRCRGHLERDASGQPVLFAGFITNLGKKNRIDPLTGLFNKFELESDVAGVLDPAQPHKLTFMMFDIDDLKRINSLHDRIFGDEVIRITAHHLQSLLPPNASLYRLDGDEFAILLRGASCTAAQQLFRLIRTALGSQQSAGGKKFYCTLSCGCAFAPDDGASYVELERCASYALECAKRRGKNRMELYTPSLVAGSRRAFELTELLRESVEQGFAGFAVCYQPVFTTAGRLAGAEALARWQCAKFGRVGPDEFIPLLEQSGLILPVGHWVLCQALAACARWQKRLPAFQLGVNLSCVQLEDEGFCALAEDALRRFAVPPQSVVLELTESYLAANMAQAEGRLRRLRASGLRIAMDDFGTGYSSLGMLKTAPVDIAKIDRAFVKGIQSSAFDNTFLRLVVELCSSVGIRTCLEGVESQAELDAVQPMGLDYIQGFLLGRPCPADKFEAEFLAPGR